MTQDANWCLACGIDFEPVEQRSLYCDACELHRLEDPTPPIPAFSFSRPPPRPQSPTPKRAQDHYEDFSAVRTRKHRDSHRRRQRSSFAHDPPTLGNTWLLDGFKTQDSIRRWCEDVRRYPLRELADATGHPDPIAPHSELSLAPPKVDLPPPVTRPRLSAFYRHSYPDILSTTQANTHRKPGFMPHLSRTPSIVHTNEEVLVISHTTQNPQSPAVVSTRPRSHSASECKGAQDTRAFTPESASAAYLHSVLRSRDLPTRSLETRVGSFVFTFVNQVLRNHTGFNILSFPSPPIPGGKLGLRITSEPLSPESSSLTRTWDFSDTHIHHSPFFKDSPPTNPSSKLLETASDAISDLALSPHSCLKDCEDNAEKQGDTLYELIGTLTQQVHDQLRQSLNPAYADALCRGTRPDVTFGVQEIACQQPYGAVEQVRLEESLNIPRGRSRSRKPVTAPLANP